MGDDGSKYGVFIIESMDLENEGKGKLDGYALKTILDLCGIKNEYFYIRTKLELAEIILEFEKSELRFLHIACHGNDKELALTFESIDFMEFGRMVGDILYHRRLFLSACQVAVFELAEQFIPRFHTYSIIGTPDDIDYDKAAIFWSSFYYLMYSLDTSQMIQVDILPTLQNVSRLFTVNLNYFSIINDANPKSINHLREIHISNGKILNDKVKLTSYRNQFR
jgi:hypothetical protein